MRKYIRIALTEDEAKALDVTRKRVEDGTRVTMTDAQFVLGLVRKAIEKKEPE